MAPRQPFGFGDPQTATKRQGLGGPLNTPYQPPSGGTRAPRPGEPDVRGPETHVWAEEDPEGTSAKVAKAGMIVSGAVPGGGILGAGKGLADLFGPSNAPYSGGINGPGGSGGPSDVTTAINNQTRANRPNQYNPFGASQWTQDANGNWIQSNTLNPALQGTAGSLSEQARINALRGIGTGEDARKQAIDAAYGQATSRLDPAWAQRDEQLGSTLANQGLDPNSQAYRNAMRQQSQQRNDAYGSAMNSAIAQGTAAQQAVFNQNLQAQQLPYDQMGALYGLLRPFGFNGAASPNVLGEAQLNDTRTARQKQEDADREAAMWGAVGKGVGVMGGLVKDNWGNWVPAESAERPADWGSQENFDDWG